MARPRRPAVAAPESKTASDGVGGRIRSLRRELRMTQPDLAAAVSVARGTVSAWEAGHYQPDGRNLFHLAQALGTTQRFLLFGEDEADSVEEFLQLALKWENGAEALRATGDESLAVGASWMERCAAQIREVAEAHRLQVTPVEPAAHGLRMGKIARARGAQGPGEGSETRKPASEP